MVLLYNKRKALSGYSYGKKCIKDRRGKVSRVNFSVGNFYLLPFIPGCVVKKYVNKFGYSYLKIIYYNGVIGYSRDMAGLSVGDFVLYNSSLNLFDFGITGNGNIISCLESGTTCSNISLIYQLDSSKFILAPGSRGISLGLSEDAKYSLIKLPSGEVRKISIFSKVTLGSINIALLLKVNKFKAGILKFIGRKGHVRGVAKNPVDHPHGGGEGKSKGGRHPVSSWGLLAKGKKTRKFKNKFLVKLG